MKLFLAVVFSPYDCLHRAIEEGYGGDPAECNHQSGPVHCVFDEDADPIPFPADCPHADFEVSRALATTASPDGDPVIKELTRVLQSRYALQKIGDGT